MNITIYGAGYVGLVTAVCLAEMGHRVCCVEIDAAKIEILMQGKIPFYEENLQTLLQKNLLTKKLFFTMDPQLAVAHGAIQMIAVGTPCLSDGSIDLSYVINVAEMISRHMSEYKLVVLKSTVMVGTGALVKRTMLEQLSQREKPRTWVDVASNPEFLKEGSAISDFMHPNRIIVGVDNEQAEALLREMYDVFIQKKYAFLTMSIRSSEMTKYAANAFLATKISFMNEMSRLAECWGADIHEIKEGMSYDERINKHFLNAGCGFGGSCFPKDVSALVQAAEASECSPHILRATLKANQYQQTVLFHKISNYFNREIKDKVIAVWGLAFKPNTDDIREASSVVLINQLIEAGAYIQAYDPLAIENIRKRYGDHSQLRLYDNAHAALENADVLAILTEWDEFRHVDLHHIKNTLRYPVVFDGRNIYDPSKMAAMDIEYYGIGRGLRSEKWT
jgi:UDPglucose 6-dehydrogenase